METNVIMQGDALEELKKLPENSVDAIITDPPYGIGFMGKEWDNFKPDFVKNSVGKSNRNTIKKDGMASPSGIRYDESHQGHLRFQEWVYLWSKEALRVLKPGGFFLCCGSTRIYHRLVCGIEDAGFEIRDTIMWLYGSGFPKSLNIGKQIDKLQGNEREVVGTKKGQGNIPNDRGKWGLKPNEDVIVDKGNSEYEGWGTALKPAVEPIVVARKPLSEKNVALNVLKWGTGGINIDECRIDSNAMKWDKPKGGIWKPSEDNDAKLIPNEQGRFPANIILDEEAGKMLDEQAPETGAFAPVKSGQKEWGGEIYHKFKTSGDDGKTFHNEGLRGASRFFYCAKASKSERNFGCEEMEDKTTNDGREVTSDRPHQRGASQRKNNHPTVKPIKLMEYLIKLVTKENAVVLDPFIGSGTTAIACLKLNRKFIGIEKEEEYVKIANARIKPYLEQEKL